MGTAVTEFELGDEFWCVHRLMPEPILGTIVGLTDADGKLIGLDFGQDMGGHSCDGRGTNGHCLWVLPKDIYTEAEWAAVSEELTAQLAARKALVGNSYEKIVLEDGQLGGGSEEDGQPGIQKAKGDLAPAASE
jgi:hypothetical protein